MCGRRACHEVFASPSAGNETALCSATSAVMMRLSGGPRTMASLAKVTRNGQITLASAIRRTLGIVEGDLVEVEVSEGVMTRTPKRLIDRDQAYVRPPE